MRALKGNQQSSLDEENEETLTELEDILIAGGENHENNPALTWKCIEE